MVRSWWVLMAWSALAACRVNFDPLAAPDAPETDAILADAATTVRLRVTGHGLLATATTGGVTCSSDCEVPAAGTLTVTAYSTEASKFDHFDAPCGISATCTIEPGQTAAATFMPRPITANRVFVTSQMAVIGVGGSSQLDAQCISAATAGGVTGNYVAYVSTAAQDAIARLNGSRGWVRLDGLPVLDLPAGINTATNPRGVGYDELRQIMPRLVLTGSDGGGRIVAGGTCMDWTSPTATMAASGSSDEGGVLMAAYGLNACAGYLYCFEIGKSVPVSLTPAPFPIGRYVFVTPAFNVTSGIAAADAACQTDAMNAGLPGSYRALLATTTQSALEHTGPLAGPWRRPDGGLVTLGDLADGGFDTGYAATALGAPTAAYIAFGANNVGMRSDVADSCNDWTVAGPLMKSIGPAAMSPFASVGVTNCANVGATCVQVP